MDRLACVNIQGYALQWVLTQRPAWQSLPVAIVSEDKPQGLVMEVNDIAKQQRIAPGIRYSQALSISEDLRATVVRADDIKQSIANTLDTLRGFSPDIEALDDPLGIFWINAKGLAPLWKKPVHWIRAIQKSLTLQSFSSQVVLGYSRFATYAISCHLNKPYKIYGSPQDECSDAHQVPLQSIPFPPQALRQLHKLGVTNVGEWVHLPSDGVLARYGPKAFKLHQLASQSIWDPLKATALTRVPKETLFFDDPIHNTERLLFAIKRPLERLMAPLAKEHRALSMLFYDIKLDRAPAIAEIIRPAEPTLDPRLIMRLLNLRLSETPMPSGVTAMHFTCKTVKATDKQLSLFKAKPQRDIALANQGLARIRAEMGNHVVQHAVLRKNHLPETRFAWEPLDTLTQSTPNPHKETTLIRRVFDPPKPIRVGQESLSALEPFLPDAVFKIQGPYHLQGGWWGQGKVYRRYYFITTHKGHCLWIYFDKKREQWFLQGLVQ